jgi:hypothetical protein
MSCEDVVGFRRLVLDNPARNRPEELADLRGAAGWQKHTEDPWIIEAEEVLLLLLIAHDEKASELAVQIIERDAALEQYPRMRSNYGRPLVEER